tara:strand:- start:1432 stop:2430 length:999 start_codon:yes stop_codon:yes gene_type:complete
VACRILGIPFRTYLPISLAPERKFLVDMHSKTPVECETSDTNNFPFDYQAIHSEDAPFQSYTQSSLNIMNKVKIDAKKILKSGFTENSKHYKYTNFFNSMVHEYQSVLSKSSSIKNLCLAKTDKCILVTLHMQPEASTSPCGLIPDQRHVVHLLASTFPDHTILVKEHPIQLLFLTTNRSHLYSNKTGFRFNGYYTSMLSRKNVIFISAYASINDIMSSYNIQALATYSGSPAVSALVKKIPVISFGIAAYTGYRGVISFNNHPSLDLRSELLVASDYLKNISSVEDDLRNHMQSLSFPWHFAQTDRNGTSLTSDDLLKESLNAIYYALKSI